MFGKLSWRDVDGVDLSELELRYITLQHRLHLLVLRLPFLTSQLHPATRLKLKMLSIFRPSTELRVRLLGTSETPQLIMNLCKRTAAEFTNNPTVWHKQMPAQQLVDQRRAALERRDRERAEIEASLESPQAKAEEPARSRTELEAKLNAQIDALGFKEAFRVQRQENRKKMDEAWEMFVSPPRLRTHWSTWIAAAIAMPAIVWFVYVLYKSAVLE